MVIGRTKMFGLKRRKRCRLMVNEKNDFFGILPKNVVSQSFTEIRHKLNALRYTLPIFLIPYLVLQKTRISRIITN